MFDASTLAKRPEDLFIQRDRRADGGERRIRVMRDGVLISRRLCGMSMLITVPVSAYRGVALDVRAGESGGACYRLSLAHRDPDFDVVLAETQDSGAVAADWKFWASWLELPRLAVNHGDAEPVACSFDENASPQSADRRRSARLSYRRPRFLSRRAPGDAMRGAVVFAGEREIISYE